MRITSRLLRRCDLVAIVGLGWFALSGCQVAPVQNEVDDKMTYVGVWGVRGKTPPHLRDIDADFDLVGSLQELQSAMDKVDPNREGLTDVIPDGTSVCLWVGTFLHMWPDWQEPVDSWTLNEIEQLQSAGPSALLARTRSGAHLLIDPARPHSSVELPHCREPHRHYSSLQHDRATSVAISAADDLAMIDHAGHLRIGSLDWEKKSIAWSSELNQSYRRVAWIGSSSFLVAIGESGATILNRDGVITHQAVAGVENIYTPSAYQGFFCRADRERFRVSDNGKEIKRDVVGKSYERIQTVSPDGSLVTGYKGDPIFGVGSKYYVRKIDQNRQSTACENPTFTWLCVTKE